jgi:hypothetical protein
MSGTMSGIISGNSRFLLAFSPAPDCRVVIRDARREMAAGLLRMALVARRQEPRSAAYCDIALQCHRQFETGL